MREIRRGILIDHDFGGPRFKRDVEKYRFKHEHRDAEPRADRRFPMPVA